VAFTVNFPGTDPVRLTKQLLVKELTSEREHVEDA
jgi:hypothetical protein